MDAGSLVSFFPQLKGRFTGKPGSAWTTWSGCSGRGTEESVHWELEQDKID
ncbi:hypothetical protein DPMN_008468 [Dreissena polymorpha]|uniref:Uncharacterized protein n=1 Tax=Dreissena polymorpha TaxID=45954 RepID=A0A9D4RZA1_DREPO|nr:hypothetical protein DPMN_008468 [Dreissena polymorpha]